MMHRYLIPLILIISFMLPSPSQAASQYTLQKIAAGFKFPDSVVEAPDGSGRLFVTELAGKVYIIDKGDVGAKPFLDISSKVLTATFGQGLYDIAFHPNFAKNGYFYVSYVSQNDQEILARYQVSANDQNSADPNSEKIILAIQQPHDFHYGGQIQFGPDGYLYLSTGDGGSAADKEGNAQNMSSLLGAILRIDVDHSDQYSIPPNNPFVADPQVPPELWAKGLRNPWRFSFDSATGDLYIADVGENTYEEIDYAPANDPGGENYGWNLFEGELAFKSSTKTGLTFPVAEYDHSNGNCAITGGYVYHGTLIPTLAGEYIFGDYCTGIIWSLEHKTNRWSITQLLRQKINITSFGQESNGEILVVDSQGGTIYQLQGQ